jgi:uncharacterized protein (DUF2235 family)
MIDGNDIVREAWRAYDRWLTEHDPEGELGAYEATEAYAKWCEQRSPQESEQ